MNYRLIYHSDHTVTYPATISLSTSDFPIDEAKAKIIRDITLANILRVKKKKA